MGLVSRAQSPDHVLTIGLDGWRMGDQERAHLLTKRLPSDGVRQSG